MHIVEKDGKLMEEFDKRNELKSEFVGSIDEIMRFIEQNFEINNDTNAASTLLIKIQETVMWGNLFMATAPLKESETNDSEIIN